jgi:hypothetical protein
VSWRPVLVVEEAGKPQINRYICLKREEASVVLIVFGYVLCECFDEYWKFVAILLLLLPNDILEF